MMFGSCWPLLFFGYTVPEGSFSGRGTPVEAAFGEASAFAVGAGGADGPSCSLGSSAAQGSSSSSSACPASVGRAFSSSGVSGWGAHIWHRLVGLFLRNPVAHLRLALWALSFGDALGTLAIEDVCKVE